MSEDALRAAAEAVARIWFSATLVDDNPEFHQAMVDLRAALASSRPEPLDVDAIEAIALTVEAMDIDREHPNEKLTTRDRVVFASTRGKAVRRIRAIAREYDRLGDKEGQDAT